MMFPIVLTSTEARLCSFVAQQRMKPDRALVADKRIGPQSAEQTDADGTAGELALCKFLGVYPAGVLCVQRPDDGEDLRVNGWGIDVKVSRYQNARLLVALHKRRLADVYVLLTGSNRNFLPVGWANREEIIKPGAIRDLGHGSTYCLEQDDLHPMGELRERLKVRKP
jgi:hypothetical protein